MLKLPATYREAVAYLDAHVGLGAKPGQERIGHLLSLMGDPHSAVPIVHIAGTNGKTSTALLVAALVGGHDLTPGVFTSPHLEAVEERLRVGDRHATPEEFTQAIADIVPFVEALEAQRGERPTYFELTVAAAFAFFAEQAAEVAVVEVGLGGRLDATSVVRPEVAVLTTVGLDHTEYLGDTLEEIAAEKLAIAKPDSILVTGELPESVADLAARHAAEAHLEHYAFGREFYVEEAVLGVGGWLVTIQGVHDRYVDVFLPLHGRHQVTNLAVAIASTEALFGRSLDLEAVRAGLAAVTVPGRVEVVRHSPLVLIDGAHNEASMAALALALEEEFPDLRWTVIFGVLGDKDAEAMLGHLEPSIGRLVVTEADSSRAVPVGKLAAQVRDRLADIPQVEIAATVAEAVAEVMGTTDADGAVLVTGSLYVAGEARRHLAGSPSPSSGRGSGPLG